MFAVLGLTISLDDLGDDNVWLDGLLLAVALAFLARPLVVGLLALPMRLRWGERLFVMWSGLRGAVPIMLGTLALLEGIEDGERIYDLIFIVVAFSVIVQGTSIPFVAPRLGVRMRDADPGGVVRRVVPPARPRKDAPCVSCRFGERTWVHAIVRNGKLMPPRRHRAGGRGRASSSCSTSATSTGSTAFFASGGREEEPAGRAAAVGRS